MRPMPRHAVGWHLAGDTEHVNMLSLLINLPVEASGQSAERAVYGSVRLLTRISHGRILQDGTAASCKSRMLTLRVRDEHAVAEIT
jgi:hypothetical protein